VSDSHAAPGDAVPADEAYPDDSSPFEAAPKRPLHQRAVPLVRRLRSDRVGSCWRASRIGEARFYPTVRAAVIGRRRGHNAVDPEPV
jgi:hypothetical protein